MSGGSITSTFEKAFLVIGKTGMRWVFVAGRLCRGRCHLRGIPAESTLPWTLVGMLRGPGLNRAERKRRLPPTPRGFLPWRGSAGVFPMTCSVPPSQLLLHQVLPIPPPHLLLSPLQPPDEFRLLYALARSCFSCSSQASLHPPRWPPGLATSRLLSLPPLLPDARPPPRPEGRPPGLGEIGNGPKGDAAQPFQSPV